MTIDTPALKLRKYSFSGTLSDRIFYSDKFQKELYHRLQIDYAKICKGKKYVEPHHKNLDLCCISGGLISYGKLDLIKEFISNLEWNEKEGRYIFHT